jgi:hypothetical protein
LAVCSGKNTFETFVYCKEYTFTRPVDYQTEMYMYAFNFLVLYVKKKD